MNAYTGSPLSPLAGTPNVLCYTKTTLINNIEGMCYVYQVTEQL